MEKRDPFKEQTVTYNTDEEIIVTKSAKIFTKGIPRLESQGKSKTFSNKAFGIGRDKKKLSDDDIKQILLDLDDNYKDQTRYFIDFL